MPSYVSDKGGGGDFKPVPAGVHVAVCDMVVSLGVQPGTAKYPEPKHQHYIRWQVPSERVEFTAKNGVAGDGPMVIGSTYTTSLNEKANLRKTLAAWRGRDFTQAELARFDLFSILGKACQISVVHTPKGDRTYANVVGVMALPKGHAPVKVEGEVIGYSEDSPERMRDLPEWLQRKITNQIRTTQPDPVEPDAPMGEEEMPF